MDIQRLQQRLQAFATARNWDKYHSPKNLTVALAVEAAELMEVFQWISPEDSVKARDAEPHHTRAADELADVVIYALRLADVLNIDLEEAIEAKLAANAAKYPDDQAHEWTIEEERP